MCYVQFKWTHSKLVDVIYFTEVEGETISLVALWADGNLMKIQGSYILFQDNILFVRDPLPDYAFKTHYFSLDAV